MKEVFLKLWFTTMLFTSCELIAYAQTKADSIDISKYEQYIEDDDNLLDADGIIKPLGIFTTTEISREVIDSILIREGYTIEPQEPNYYHSYSYYLRKPEYGNDYYNYYKRYNVNISNQENPSANIFYRLRINNDRIYEMTLRIEGSKDSKGKSIKAKKVVKSLVNFYKKKGVEVRKYKYKNLLGLTDKWLTIKGYELIYRGHYMRLLVKPRSADIIICYNENKYVEGFLAYRSNCVVF